MSYGFKYESKAVETADKIAITGTTLRKMLEASETPEEKTVAYLASIDISLSDIAISLALLVDYTRRLEAEAEAKANEKLESIKAEEQFDADLAEYLREKNLGGGRK